MSDWSDSETAKRLKAAGRSASDSGDDMISGARSEAASRIGPVSYKRGGKVRRTGPANLHKGERVVPASKVKRVEKMMKRSKMRMTNKRGGR